MLSANSNDKQALLGQGHIWVFECLYTSFKGKLYFVFPKCKQTAGFFIKCKQKNMISENVY